MLIKNKLPNKEGYSIKYALTAEVRILYLLQGAENVMARI